MNPPVGVTQRIRQLGLAIVPAALCWLLPSPARANPIIDPAMKVLADDFSNAILQGTTFFPNGGGGGVFGFFNAGNQNITELTFQTAIAPNLDQSTISAAFACNQGNLNPFFKFCGVNYSATTGLLTIAFWGTNPVTNPGGIQQGVPPLPSGCISTPDAIGCHPQGHFAISLADTFDINSPDQSGGWSFDKNPLLFTASGPTFTTTEIQNVFGAVPAFVPEPACAGFVGLGLAGMVWINARRRRRAASPDPESRS